MFSYVMDVLLPECIIRLLMETRCIDYSAVSNLCGSLLDFLFHHIIVGRSTDVNHA